MTATTEEYATRIERLTRLERRLFSTAGRA